MVAWRIVLIVVVIALAASVLALVVAGTVIMRAGRCTPPDDLTYLIVLGAQVRADGMPTRALRFRLEAAQAYLAGHPTATAIVSGGRGADEPLSEAAVMARWLEVHDIERSRIIREEASTTTAENLACSIRLIPGLRDARVGLVTNDFHLYRALCIARKQGFQHVYGVPAASTRRNLPKNLIRECFALVKNRIQGNL